MKYKIGDKVTSKRFLHPGVVGEITSTFVGSWDGRVNYSLSVIEGMVNYAYHLYEEELELLTPEVPAQGYLDLFM